MLTKLSVGVMVFFGAALSLFGQNSSTTDVVVFICSNGSILEYYSDQASSSPVWSVLNLSSATGAPLPAQSSPLATVRVFDSDTVTTDHVLYLESNGDIGEEIWNTNSETWEYVDDTTLANAPVAASTSALGVSSQDTAQYNIIYQGTNGHIYDLFVNGSAYSYTDVTAALPSGQIPATATGSPLTGLATGDTANPTFFCVDVNKHIDAISSESGAWSGEVLGGSPFAPPSGGMFGFENIQNENFLEDQFVNASNQIEYFYDVEGTWTLEQPTGFSAGAFPFVVMESSGGDAGEDSFYIAPGTAATVNEIHQVGSTYTESQPSVLAGAPNATPSAKPAIWAFWDGSKIRIYYSGPDNHIIELDGTDASSWSFTDVTNLVGGATFSGAGLSQITGFSL
jgi:hypothetical protein